MTGLMRLAACVEELRKVFPSMTLQGTAMFLYISNHPGCRANDLIDALGMSSSNITNIVKQLDERGWNKPSLALVRYENDPNDARKKLFFLAPRGERIARSLRAIITGEATVI